MEWTSRKRDVMHRSGCCLRKGEDGFVGVIWVSHLRFSRTQWSSSEHSVLQYLFNKLSATYHQSGVFTLGVFIQSSWRILETTWNHKLKVPGTPLPEAVDARNPATRCIWRRRRCVYVGYALRSINKIQGYKEPSRT